MANTTWNASYLMYLLTSSHKIRREISSARLTKPWQYIHQNVRLGRGKCALSPHAETRYRGDVIRKKRRQKTPFIFNGGNQK